MYALDQAAASGTGHAPLGGFSGPTHPLFTFLVTHPDVIGKVLSLCPNSIPLNSVFHIVLTLTCMYCHYALCFSITYSCLDLDRHEFQFYVCGLELSPELQTLMDISQ